MVSSKRSHVGFIIHPHQSIKQSLFKKFIFRRDLEYQVKISKIIHSVVHRKLEQDRREQHKLTKVRGKRN